MNPHTVTVTYVVLCVALFYTCFCRLVRMDKNTHTSIRLAFCVLLATTVLCGALPFYTTFSPTLSDLPMPAAMLLVQALTARYWKDGVPSHFQKCVCETTPSNRTSTT